MPTLKACALQTISAWPMSSCESILVVWGTVGYAGGLHALDIASTSTNDFTVQNAHKAPVQSLAMHLNDSEACLSRASTAT